MIDDPLVKSLLLSILETEENLEIVKCLIDGIGTDEEIAEKTGIKLNFVRKFLYKLYDAGLASYKRSKDPETQWYTYSWKFDEEEVINIIKNSSELTLKQLNEELENEESNMFFICPEGHYRLNFENSSELEFICPECGEELIFHDNAEIIEELKRDIEIVENNFKSFSKKIK
ncbi:MAG: transcription factor E [Methanobrevibacter sp.]|uniref:transcription factor E n=1 Tax=Methanobrevibacter sp. TaxID=66852 RepID=UPI0026DEF793|nr:transcription factor E [Methanobrevibacter sp.]MDO5848451.1 transcription factor E [Methanobrevibacter sp.]